ncbi:hypothetical protein C8J57DRAFT_1229108 [Mycena rebaudengoi]|nr:hypothetical protein C8J57DRAFT_1229108 [Mycena rebaudengoi]
MPPRRRAAEAEPAEEVHPAPTPNRTGCTPRIRRAPVPPDKTPPPPPPQAAPRRRRHQADPPVEPVPAPNAPELQARLTMFSKGRMMTQRGLVATCASPMTTTTGNISLNLRLQLLHQTNPGIHHPASQRHLTGDSMDHLAQVLIQQQPILLNINAPPERRTMSGLFSTRKGRQSESVSFAATY